jgi:hypothetical protein
MQDLTPGPVDPWPGDPWPRCLTPGPAAGPADKTVSRPRRLGFLLPLQGEGWDGGGDALCSLLIYFTTQTHPLMKQLAIRLSR